MPTAAPALARASAAARPRPVPAPVTRATRPAKGRSDMLLLLGSFLAVTQAPQPHDEVLAAASARQDLAIGRERQRLDAVLVAGERLQQLAGRGVPELDRFILAATGEQHAVGRKDD